MAIQLHGPDVFPLPRWLQSHWDRFTMSGPSVAASVALLAATVFHSAAIDVVVSSDGHLEADGGRGRF